MQGIAETSINRGAVFSRPPVVALDDEHSNAFVIISIEFVHNYLTCGRQNHKEKYSAMDSFLEMRTSGPSSESND